MDGTPRGVLELSSSEQWFDVPLQRPARELVEHYRTCNGTCPAMIPTPSTPCRSRPSLTPSDRPAPLRPLRRPAADGPDGSRRLVRRCGGGSRGWPPAAGVPTASAVTLRDVSGRMTMPLRSPRTPSTSPAKLGKIPCPEAGEWTGPDLHMVALLGNWHRHRRAENPAPLLTSCRAAGLSIRASAPSAPSALAWPRGSRTKGYL